MGVVLQGAFRRVAEASGHPEVDQQGTPTHEPDDQILATTLQGRDTLALEFGGTLQRLARPYEPRVVDPHLLERATDEPGLEPGADGLDLGQLGPLGPPSHGF